MTRRTGEPRTRAYPDAAALPTRRGWPRPRRRREPAALSSAQAARSKPASRPGPGRRSRGGPGSGAISRTAQRPRTWSWWAARAPTAKPARISPSGACDGQRLAPDAGASPGEVDPDRRGSRERRSHQPDQALARLATPEAEQRQRHQPAGRRRELRAVRDLALLAGELPPAFRGGLGSVLGHGAPGSGRTNPDRRSMRTFTVPRARHQACDKVAARARG